ncbi:glucose-1-phosphate adenylyltransferase subunit GlgD [Fervidibacillus albus]|uniref:Glucose-1-phosphate adenylyltransferase subunit GlgD n=1 Tax=Fervidibacillus albus TaxID=2980026 RepID=A0A9E8LWU1_9BACI|nr:glucose-1-phosphate adenylyltransferase subunit GlgD [Fervidibacillus albus]WAA11168.1 glucose-1-phosphate adenylyltransferase subunit GlgD [Fervidibacillus albus]
MSRLMGLINLEHESQHFHELTYSRSSASIPFAGRYRLIDFPLSNMVNSNIDEVALFIHNKFRSLLDHLGTGASWDLDRTHGGLFLLPIDGSNPMDMTKGDLRFFRHNQDYFLRSPSTHVLISGSQFIANTNYRKAFEYHLERDADVTLITTRINRFLPEHRPLFRIEADDLGWVQQITNDQANPVVFTGVYIINKDLLLALVNDCIAYNRDNFFINGIMDHLSSLKVQSYQFDGPCAFINSIESYYRHNMNLLTEKHYRELFYEQDFVKTKISNNPPVKFKERAAVTNSILSTGCIIDGNIEKSILFRGVEVKKGAVIKNSIIMQRCTIEEDVYLENVILDKDVQITKGQKLIGSTQKPFVIAKRQVV